MVVHWQIDFCIGAVLFSCQAELADAIEESQKKLEAFADPQGGEDGESHRLNLCALSINTRIYAKLGNFSETFHESKGVGNSSTHCRFARVNLLYHVGRWP